MSLIDDSLAIMMKSGGSGFQRVLLYDSGSHTTYAASDTDINLLDNLSNYDVVAVGIGTPSDNSENYALCYAWFDVGDALTDSDVFANAWQGYYCRWLQVFFTDTTFRYRSSNNNSESSNQIPKIFKIYGYKW